MSCALPAAAMRRITLQELAHLGVLYPPSLTRAAARYGRSVKLYLHWSAGHYGQFFEDYHVQIDADGAVYVIGGGALDDVLAQPICATAGASACVCLAAHRRGRRDLGRSRRPPCRLRPWRRRVQPLPQGFSYPLIQYTS